MLVVAVIFAVIFFELSEIYQQSSFVGNPINNDGICSNSFPTLWNISKELFVGNPVSNILKIYIFKKYIKQK